MNSREIREKFLRFFEERGHRRLPSASLIPANDPSILWTAAGMVPFKPYFTGTARPETPRVTTCQKCLRTLDIESVGRTARHHTFFEMLGNFSFGDYFKDEAISWAWEFVTKELGLEARDLWITIFSDDDEAFDVWHRRIGVTADRIVRMGKDTNFWEIGVGPCGPCSEIYVDLGESRGCGSASCGVGCDCDRFLEIWNLVFIQYFKDESGNYSPLDNKGIDTGMGLERVASVLQGVPTNFDTDLFRGIIDFTAGLAGKEYGADPETDTALKIIVDHSRAIAFAMADGAVPSNEGRGYVLRRLLRRAARYGRLLGVEGPFLYRVAGAVVRQMGDVYPELVEKQDYLSRLIKIEEERFGETLIQGTEILNRLVEEAERAGRKAISGRDAFRLYDTYGFPLELTREMAAERGLEIDEAGFIEAMEEQRRRARSARHETEYLSEQDAFYKSLRDSLGENRFVGYEVLECRARVLALVKGTRVLEKVETGEEFEFVLDVTPCYAEAGGQVSDHAVVKNADAEVSVLDVVKAAEGLYLHRGQVLSGVLRVGDEVDVKVDFSRRVRVARNHSATHLLHRALKEVLGEHVNQAGSLVAPDRLRFDFTHFAPLSGEEIRRVEEVVNGVILQNLPVETFVTSQEEALKMGAVALFGEKYGDRVRVVKMGDFSLELCGGTHVRFTAEIGLFKMVSEGSIGSGLRRVEAVTGDGVLRYIEAREEQLARVGAMLKSSPLEIVGRVESLLAELKELEQENDSLRAKLARYEVEKMLESVREVNGVKVLAVKTEAADMDGLRAMVDLLRDKLGSGVILLGAVSGAGKVNLVAGVSKDLVARGVHAGRLVKEIAPLIGGGGGGRPDMAQAGGKEPSRLQEALDRVYDVVSIQLKS